MIRRVLAIFLLCVLAGCSTLGDYTLAKRSNIDAQIATARAATETQLKAINDQQVSLLRDKVGALESREQGAADYLFKGSAVAATLKTPSRPELVMGQSIQQTATQLPPATAAAQTKAFNDLKTELDETRISADALRAQYETELGKARAEGAAKEVAVKDLTTKLDQVDKDRVAVLTKANATEVELGDKRKALSDAALAAKAKEADDAKSVQALKLKMSSITGILTLLCIAGAIWSPVFKQQLGLGAVVFAVVTGAIWYVTGPMIAAAVAIAVLGLVLWAVKNHYLASKTLSNVVHAVQEVKTTAKADYDRVLAPALASWQTTYDKGGNTVPDQAAIAHVDAVLMSTGAK